MIIALQVSAGTCFIRNEKHSSRLKWSISPRCCIFLIQACVNDQVAELREQVAALQEALATRAKFAMSASSTPAVTLPAPAPAPAAAASSTKPPPVKPVQDKDKDKGGSAKGASAALAKQPATSFSAAAYKDDFEEYEDEFEDDN